MTSDGKRILINDVTVIVSKFCKERDVQAKDICIRGRCKLLTAEKMVRGDRIILRRNAFREVQGAVEGFLKLDYEFDRLASEDVNFGRDYKLLNYLVSCES